MKEQLHRVVSIIAVMTLAMSITASAIAQEGSEESPVILEYKLKEGDQLILKVSMDADISMPGRLAEIKTEALLTQVVSEVSDDGSFELINIGISKLMKATDAGRDMSDQLWRGVKEFDVFRQKKGKDGSIIDHTGGLDIFESLDFWEPTTSFGVLPDEAVKVGSSWRQTVREKMGDVPIMYTVAGFEEKKGFRCAVVKGELIEPFEINPSVTLTKAENTTYFAVKEGVNVGQETLLTTQAASGGGNASTDVRLTMELQDRKHLPPEELEEIVESAGLIAVGIDHFEKKQYEAAETVFRKFLSSYKESPWRSDVEKLLTRASEELLKKPVALASTLHERLQACIDEGDLDRLLEMSEEAIAADPERRQSSVVWYMLVRGYERYGKLDELLAHFQEKLNEDPENTDIYMIVGQIYERQQDTEKAMETYEKTLEVAPDDVDAMTSLGNVYNRVGMHEEAIATYRKAIEHGRVYLYSSMAQCYAALGRSEEALKLIDEVKKASQERGFASSFLPSTTGDIYTAIGRYQEAIKSYKEAIKLANRNDRSSAYKLLSCYRAAGMSN